jgi:RNA-directed DNA polymerase
LRAERKENVQWTFLVNEPAGAVAPERKRKNLIRLGVDQDHAYAFSRTRKGGWAIAQSPILTTTITLKRLKQRGYQSLTDVYIELNPSLCEPPST